MSRRTKILATLGPATDSSEMIEGIIAAGANVVRMNFSHGQAQDHIDRAKRVRDAAKKLNTHVAILGDLQGPKIRVSRFKNDSVILKSGQDFTLDAELGKFDGDETQVGIDYKALPDDVKPNDTLLLDDGRIQLIVVSVSGRKVHTKVTVAGKLSNNKGINRQGGGLSAEALTKKDKEDIITAAAMDVDYLAVSFPRSGADLDYARSLAEEAGCYAKICAKVATQMMESMIESPMPTRAEVMDVANAVLDGTDAVMLSAETAAGSFPVETVKAMARVCEGAETHTMVKVSKHRLDQAFGNVTETIAMSAVYAANHLPSIKAIVGLTESGTTPKLMSRITSSLPIFALSRHEKTLNNMTLYRGVNPIFFDSRGSAPGEMTKDVMEALKASGCLKIGDQFILTYGDTMETIGATNACKVVTVA